MGVKERYITRSLYPARGPSREPLEFVCEFKVDLRQNKAPGPYRAPHSRNILTISVLSSQRRRATAPLSSLKATGIPRRLE